MDEFNEDEYFRELQLRIEEYVSAIQLEMGKAAADLVRIAITYYGGGDFQGIFNFALKPTMRKAAELVFEKLSGKITTIIDTAQKSEWIAASKKNDALVKYIFRRSNRTLTKETLAKFGGRNLEALSAFQGRKIDGLKLSDRVWNITKQFKKEVEFSLDIGIGEGKSAARLSQDIRANLKDPERLFRRVRDKHGNLKLSQAAKEYNPGKGVYRSSAKNAMRLTRTEVNGAYHDSENIRRGQLDFVVGIEVKLSNNPNHCPTCVMLAGKYPKGFKFKGWHPQCRCSTRSILITREEMDRYLDRILAGERTADFKSVNTVAKPHGGFDRWLKENEDRVRKNWKNLPEWMVENEKFI